MSGRRKMKSRQPAGWRRRSALAVALLLGLAGAAVAGSLTAQNPATVAGSITALIPLDFVHRGRTSFEAQKGADILWDDLIRTERGGRVRVALTDGSVLNIGSGTELKILRHDAASEQTELELIYGKVRADVIQRTRPDGEFKVRTRQAVAGVIGTGEYLDATPTDTTVIALNGIVAVSSNNPTIPGTVFLKPGQKTQVVANQAPEPPTDATEEEIDEAHNQTSSQPHVSLEPRSALAGTVVEAVISGKELAGASAVTFSHDGITAALGESTAETLAVTLTVAEMVSPGTYSFTVLLPDDRQAEGRFAVRAQDTGGAAGGGPLPPDPVITGEDYYDPHQPPEPLISGQVDVAQGAVLRLSGADSTSADGHPISQLAWSVPGTRLKGSGPTFEVDTWLLQPGSHKVRLRVTDDDGHSARTELDLTVRELPNSDDVIDTCLVGGYEARDVNQFMRCFSAELFRGYPVLEEGTRNFLQNASEVRVYRRIDNRQVQKDDATYQVRFETTFTTEANPDVSQQRTETITLRMLLHRYRDSEEWKIVDFSSQVAATGTSSQLLSADFSLQARPETIKLIAGGAPVPATIAVEALSGFSDTVQLSLRGLPTGVTALFAQAQAALPAGSSTTLTLSAAPDARAATFSEVQVVGRSGSVERTSPLTVQVQSASIAPIAVDQAVTTDEDIAVDILLSAVDLDGDPLTFGIVSGPTQGTLSGLAPNLTYTPDANFNGSDSFTFKANDGALDSNIATVSITVNPVNDPPVIDPIADQAVTVGDTLLVDLSATDPDTGDTLTFSLGPSTPAFISLSGATLTITPTAGDVGPHIITVMVTDSAAATDSTSFNLQVNGVPAISVSPTSHDFGNVLVSSTSPAQTFTISNTGTADLTVSSIALGGGAGFALSSTPGLPALVAPGGSVTFDATFSPVSTGPANDTVTILSDAGLASVSLSGTGIQGALGINPASLDFGNILLGATGTATVTLTNAGSATVTLSSITLTGGAEAGFAVDITATAFLLAPGEETTFDVSFTPNVACASVIGEVLVASDAPGAPHAVALAGTGVQPALQVSPTSIDFGTVNVGSRASASVSLTNIGCSTLTIASIALTKADTGFSLDTSGTSSPLAPGSSTMFSVTFSPLAGGPVDNSVAIVSDAPSSPEGVSLAATGQAAPNLGVSPSPVDFGDVAIGHTAAVTLVVSNTGTGTLTLTSISTSSFDCPGTFSFAGDLIPPVNIAPGGGVSFDVTFTPTTARQCRGTLTLTSNAVTSPTETPLVGRGVDNDDDFVFELRIRNDPHGSENSRSHPLPVVQSDSASVTVSAVREEERGFSGQVTITVNGPFPTGLTVNCVDPGGKSDNCLSATEARVFLNKPQDESAGFRFTANESAAPGLYPIQVVATGGGTTQVTTIFVEVVPPAPGEGALVQALQGDGKKATSSTGDDPEDPPTSLPRWKELPDAGGSVTRADLAVEASQLSLEPLQPQAGQRVRLLVPVRNLGSGAADDFTLALSIPAWNIRTEQKLSLRPGEEALVEFAFDLPAVLSQRRVAARVVADPENRVADANRTNNRGRVAHLLPASAPLAGGQRSAISLSPGECVSIRLDTGGTTACGQGGDFELSTVGSGFTLAANSVRDLGRGRGRLSSTKASPGGAGVPRAAVQVGHVYEVGSGARRAHVRIVQVQELTAPKRVRDKIPASLDGPQVNDPFKLPAKKRSGRRAVVGRRVVLEWVVLP